MKVSDENPGWHKAVYNDKVKCVKCDEILDDEQEFREHHESKHPGEPIICQLCNAELKDRAAYTKHKWTNHNRPYACDYCKFTSCKIPLVKKHILAKHTQKAKKSSKQKARAEDKSNKFAEIIDKSIFKEEKDNEIDINKSKENKNKHCPNNKETLNTNTTENNLSNQEKDSDGQTVDAAASDDINHYSGKHSDGNIDERTNIVKSETKPNLRPKSRKSIIEDNSDSEDEQNDSKSDNDQHSDYEGIFCFRISYVTLFIPALNNILLSKRLRYNFGLLHHIFMISCHLSS